MSNNSVRSPIETESPGAASANAPIIAANEFEYSAHTANSNATSSNAPAPTSTNANALDAINETEGTVGENPWAKVTAEIWKYFECKVIDGKKTATCTYCKEKMLGDPKMGTSHLNKHLGRCKRKKSIDIRQQILQGNFNKDKEKFELTSYQFNQEASCRDLAMAIITHEYPLMMVDHWGFRNFCNSLNPKFKVVSRNTLKADCLRMYEKEKKALMSTFEKHQGRVAITTDMWTTSSQNKGYMVVTGHYIDKNWNIQKRILSFVHVLCPHTSEVLCDALVQSLLDWNLDRKISTITVDNCTTNDSMMRMILGKLPMDSLLLDGSLIHMRCAAHILNLVVKKGLEVIGSAIENIRESTAYWTHTPKRWEKFEETARQLRIPIVKKLSLDCDTRWNSTYLMLRTALEYKDVFFRLKQRDPKYKTEPSELDWSMTRKICERLNVFYTTTEVFSGTKYPTTSLYFPKICEVRFALKEWMECGTNVIESMAAEMMIKFEKYFSVLHGIMGISAILDPRYKLVLVEFYFSQIYGDSVEFEVDKIKDIFRKLVEQYELQEQMLGESSTSSTPKTASGVSVPEIGLSTNPAFLKYASLKRKAVRSDLDLYLEEDTLPWIEDFDILSWWKNNQSKYPILYKIAKDVLAVPVSTVASESAFSTSGRLINAHRSRLHPKTVEALMCTQDWITASWRKESTLGVVAPEHATMMYDSNCETEADNDE